MTSIFDAEEVAARRERRAKWIQQMGYYFKAETIEAFHQHAEAQFQDRATRAIAIFKDYEAKHGKAARNRLEFDALTLATNDSSGEFLDHLQALVEART